MYSYSTIAAVWLLLPALFLLRVLQKAYFTPLAKVPGPWYAPFTHLWLKKQVLTGDRTHYIHAMHEKYGRVVRISPNEVSVSDAQAFKEIHRVGSPFVKSDWYTLLSSGGPGAPPGVFNMRDPKEHSARRKMFARGFSRDYLRNNWEEIVHEKVKLAVSRIKDDSAQNGKSDAMRWWMYMASDITSILMFGESFQMLESGVKADYITAIENANFEGSFHTELSPIWWICRHIPLKRFREIFYASDALGDKGYQAVVNSRASSPSTNIFATINAATEKGETKLDDFAVQCEAGNFIVAGADTTANTLTFAIWSILKQPDLQKILVEEVTNYAGQMNDASLEKLPILNAVIDETLRLFCAAPATLPRVTPPNGATLGGYFIPEGAIVGTQAYSIHRDAALWPNAEVFDHTRWLSPERISDAARASYSPWGAGSRICMGMHVAKMELRLAITTFFRECPNTRLAPSTTDKSMELKIFFLITPKGHKMEVICA